MEFRPYITTALRRRVHFAAAAGQLQTLEGPVAYAAGDAIVTGVAGEQWPVPADSFAAANLRRCLHCRPGILARPASCQTHRSAQRRL